jgi:hypothetical protein
MKRRCSSPCRYAMFRAVSLALACAAGATLTHAAGGHHAVDDANMLDEGRCKLEVWTERETGGARALVHAGPGCRVGPVELDLNIERQKFAGLAGSTSFSPQVKWATSLNEQLSFGLVAGSSFTSQSPRYTGSTVYIPLTWHVSDGLLAHVNWGRDFQRGGPNQARGGLALEWTATAEWSFVVERFFQAGASSARVGARWALTPGVSLDISRASTLGLGGPTWATVGINWQFDRVSKPPEPTANVK